MKGLIFLAPLLLAGCTYVKVSDAGATVRQATAEEVAGCKDIGEVASATRAKVVVKRPSGKVKQELIDLARNQAAGMGATDIVPNGPPENGAQTFTAYKCS